MYDPARCVMSEASSSAGREGSGREWLAQSWRLTAFLQSPAAPPESDWWVRLVGQEPDSRTANPKQGVRQEQGAYGSGTLVLTTQPGRVDWLYSSELPNQETLNFEAVPTLGPVIGALATFRQIAFPWLSNCPPVIRIAFGSILQRPVQSRDDAYAVIMDMVPGLRLTSPECSDFMYQINRPRRSTVAPEYSINRLSKWSAAAFQTVQITVGLAAQSLRPVIEPQYSARLDMDINTAPAPELATGRQTLISIFEELVELSTEISEKGDID
jgi:hypothetical protein